MCDTVDSVGSPSPDHASPHTVPPTHTLSHRETLSFITNTNPQTAQQIHMAALSPQTQKNNQIWKKIGNYIFIAW